MYAIDKRTKNAVMRRIKEKIHTIPEIATVYNIGEGTVSRWKK